jgi:8-oxo-dGTP diphosphatase
VRGIGRGTIVAAGAVVWRVREGGLQVLSVHRPSYNDWSWPKGKIWRGETLPACAMREVFEETGKQVELGQPLPSLTYTLANGREKTVHYWAAETMGTTHPSLLARPRWPLAPRKEIDNTRWFTVEQARKTLTMAADLKPLEALVEAYEADRLETRALIIARHARAVKRAAWNREDIARPITAGGAKRAHQLIQLFSAFGVRYIESSPADRCMATVQPYATAIGMEISTSDALTEPAHASHPVDAAEALMATLAKPGNRLMCVHRPTLPTLMTMMEAATRVWTRGKLPNTNPYLPAGGVLVAHVIDTESGPRIAAVETHFLA